MQEYPLFANSAMSMNGISFGFKFPPVLPSSNARFQKFYALNFYEFIPGIVGGIPRIFLLARGCSRRSGLEFGYCEVPRHNLVSHRSQRCGTTVAICADSGPWCSGGSIPVRR
jgi:hypothetical protein